MEDLDGVDRAPVSIAVVWVHWRSYYNLSASYKTLVVDVFAAMRS